MNEKTAIAKACELAGGLSSLARLIGVKPPTVHQWTTGERSVPLIRCFQIERATSGAVRCKDLRPDVDWELLRSTSPTTPAKDAA